MVLVNDGCVAQRRKSLAIFIWCGAANALKNDPSVVSFVSQLIYEKLHRINIVRGGSKVVQGVPRPPVKSLPLWPPTAPSKVIMTQAYC